MSNKCVIKYNENGSIDGIDIKNPSYFPQTELENVELELSNRQIAEDKASEKAKRAIEHVNAETAKAGTSKAIWESVAENWAKENNFWIEDYEEGYSYATQGGEHLVYTEDGNTETIRKVNHDIDNLSDWYKNLLDFNQLFPNTSYEIVGFTRLKKNYYAEGSYNQGIGAKGNFSVVVKQNFIPNKQIITQEEIQNYLEYLGFERMGTSNDYRQGDVILGDMNIDNVIKDRDGDYHVIDAYVDIENQLDSSDNDYTVPNEALIMVTEELVNSGLADEVIIMNSQELKEVLKNYNQEEYSKIPNGFYIKSTNEIYLNSENPNIIETAFHEFAHPYLKWLSKSRNDLYTEGVKLLNSNKEEAEFYINHVKETQPNLNEFNPKFEEEVLAQIIGDNGAKLLKSKEQSSIKDWLESFWNEIKSLLGLSKMTAEAVSNLTLKQFSEQAIKDITSLNLNTLSVLEKPVFKSMRDKQVSKQNILNLIKGNDVKQAEKDIITEVLSSDTFDSKKINYNLFEAMVRESILPLRKITTNNFSNYGRFSDEYDKVETVVYDSPVDHNTEGHFEVGSNTAYGHTRVWSDYYNRIYSIAELQSDFFQNKKDIDSTFSKDNLTNFEKQMSQSRKIHKQRLVRESIKDASSKGYSKFRLPTPYTLAKIEKYIPASIKTGDNILDEVEYEGELYKITNKIGSKYSINKPSDIVIKTRKEVDKEIGKKDATQYEINEFYLKNYTNVAPYGDSFVLTTELSKEVDLSDNIINKENFNISDLNKDVQGIVKSYEDLGKFLHKERGDNFKIITDNAGYDWYETDLLPSDNLDGVIAFQMSNKNEIDSPLFESLKQNPLLTEEQALEIYKQSFSTKLEDWDTLDLNC